MTPLPTCLTDTAEDTYMNVINFRKLKHGRGYSMVAPAENGILPNSKPLASTDHHDAGKQDKVEIFNELDEEKEKKKRVPSVKVRLFKKLQNGAASRSSKSKLEFDADDFDVPIQKVIQYILDYSYSLPHTDVSHQEGCLQS